MAKSEIDKLAEELIAKYDIRILTTAAYRLMLQESGKEEGNYTKERIAEFVGKLDFDRLIALKLIADELKMEERLSNRHTDVRE